MCEALTSDIVLCHSSSSKGHFPPGRFKCPTTPLFSMLCLFPEFPVSVLYHPVYELLSRSFSFSLPLHASFHPLSSSVESCHFRMCYIFCYLPISYQKAALGQRKHEVQYTCNTCIYEYTCMCVCL